MEATQVISVEELDEKAFAQRYGQVKTYFLTHQLSEPHFWLYGGRIEELDPPLFVIITSWNTHEVFTSYLANPINTGAKLRNFTLTEPFKKPEKGRVLELFSGFMKISEAE